MPELLSLECPSCGAKNDAPETSDQITCAYCGNVYRIYRQVDEASLTPSENTAKAPQNDLEKTTTMFTTQRVQPEPERFIEEPGTFTPEKNTVKKIYYYTYSPGYKKTLRIGLYTGIFGIVAFIVLAAINTGVNSESNPLGCPLTLSCLAIILGVMITIIGLILRRRYNSGK